MSSFIDRLRREAEAHPSAAAPWLDLANGIVPAPEWHALRAACALRLADPQLAIARFLAAAQGLAERSSPLRQGLALALERAGHIEDALGQWLRLAKDDPLQPGPLAQTIRLIESLGLGGLPCIRDLYATQLSHLRAAQPHTLRRAVRALGQSSDPTVIGAVWLEEGRIAGWVLDLARPSREVAVSISLAQTLVTIPASARFPVGRAFQFALPKRGDRGLIIDVWADNGARLAGAPLRLGPLHPPPRALPPGAPSLRPGHGVALILPVYRDRPTVARCLESLLASRAQNHTRFRLVLVNDASPEPGLGAWLRSVALQNQGIYLETARNCGFIGAINLALSLCRGRDLVWLNSDTLVAGDWLDRLRAAAHSAPEVATVTPLSNNAQLFSYPKTMRDNPLPDLQGTRDLQRLAAAANDGVYLPVPTGLGFCLYLKAEAIAAAGRLDDQAYLLGYAEEIDYCLRLAEAGWRHLCATDVYVAHQGNVSFRSAKGRLAKDNERVLRQRYPLQTLAIGAFRRQDPLSEARGRLERLWLAAQPEWDGLFLFSARTANRYYTYRLLSQRLQAGKRDLQVRCLSDRQGLIALLEGALDAPPCNLGFRLPAQRLDLLRELLALRLRERITILHDQDLPPLMLDLLAALPQSLDLIRLDDSLEMNNSWRARLPPNHVPYSHTRYRQRRWERLQGQAGQLNPLQAAATSPRHQVSTDCPSDRAWVAILLNGFAVTEQQRLRALARLQQTQIRWLVIGAVHDAPALLSTGRCECFDLPPPDKLLEYLSWIGCRAVLNPSERPGPDPSPFLISRDLGLPYIGVRAADGLSYLAEPATWGFNPGASPESILQTTLLALDAAKTPGL